jgi:hypothetical protein
MSDCGCGSSDGNCTDNLDSNAKNAQLTGNISYDGSAISCLGDSSIDVSTNESLNSILQKILSNLCNSNNYLAFAKNNILVSNSNSGNQIDFDFAAGKIKSGNGIKIKMSAEFNAVTHANGIVFKFTHKAKETGGSSVGVLEVEDHTIAQGTNGGQVVMDCTYFFNPDSSNEIGYSLEVNLNNSNVIGGVSTTNVYSGIRTIPFNQAPYDAVGVKFDIEVSGSDSVQCRYLSIEHLR